jgi:hypothetical protein
MDNPDISIEEVTEQRSSVDVKKGAKKLVFLAVVVTLLALLIWLFVGDSTAKITEAIAQTKEVETITQTKEVAISLIKVEKDEKIEVSPLEIEKALSTQDSKPQEPEVITEVISLLPALDDSDSWLKLKLPDLTWRTELLKLVIDEDMIRLFVVFTDNFSQGSIAYDHSPLLLLKQGSVLE